MAQPLPTPSVVPTPPRAGALDRAVAVGVGVGGCEGCVGGIVTQSSAHAPGVAQHAGKNSVGVAVGILVATMVGVASAINAIAMPAGPLPAAMLPTTALVVASITEMLSENSFAT